MDGPVVGAAVGDGLALGWRDGLGLEDGTLQSPNVRVS